MSKLMNDDPEVTRQSAAIQHLLLRLDEFARGLGLAEAETRQVVEEVAADMQGRTSDEWAIEARARMILATV